MFVIFFLRQYRFISTKAAYLRTPRVRPSSHCSLAYGSVATLTGRTSVDGAVSRRHYDLFLGQEVVVTEKIDGENTTMYPDHIHARSLDSNHHPSRNIVKQLHGQVNYPSHKGRGFQPNRNASKY